MSEAIYMPIGHAPHLSHVTAWLTEDGKVETMESPLLAANMASEPPELVPLMAVQVPEGAPQRKLLHDSVKACWFDLADGKVLTSWRECVALLYALWDARQPAQTKPSAPPKPPALEVPNYAPDMAAEAPYWRGKRP